MSEKFEIKASENFENVKKDKQEASFQPGVLHTRIPPNRRF